MMYDIFENEISGTITCQSTNYECTNNEWVTKYGINGSCNCYGLIMSFILELLLVHINDESAMNGPDSLKPLLASTVYRYKITILLTSGLDYQMWLAMMVLWTTWSKKYRKVIFSKSSSITIGWPSCYKGDWSIMTWIILKITVLKIVLVENGLPCSIIKWMKW